MKTFTIITPVYNSQSYIEKCLLSVINQKYNLNLVQHILINDGSTDKSEEIIKKYQNKYPHIKYFKKQNGNWGSVINYVLNNKLINNQYVIICDSDDVIRKNCLRIINKKIKDNDLFMSSSYLWNGKSIHVPVFPYYYLFRTKIFPNKKKQKIFTSILIPNTLCFSQSLFYNAQSLREKNPHQDAILFADLFTKAKKISFTKSILSKYYIFRSGNTMTNITNEKTIKVIYENLQWFANHDLPEYCFYYLMGMKNLKKYMLKNNLKLSVSHKPSLKWFPWYVRFIVFIFWKINIVKKYFIITK